MSEICAVCGFSDNGVINREFLIKEDANYWLETVVKPHRKEWEFKKRETELMVQINELKTQLVESCKWETKATVFSESIHKLTVQLEASENNEKKFQAN